MALTKSRDIRLLPTPELEKRLQESTEALVKMRFAHGTRQLENTALLRTTRKEIARMTTILKERQRETATQTK